MLAQFCNPTGLYIDQNFWQSIDKESDRETGETKYIVDLSIIFHGTSGCHDNDADDTTAQCQVVIGDDDDNTVKSVKCETDEPSENDGKNKIYLSF